jgi:hypothetical protein
MGRTARAPGLSIEIHNSPAIPMNSLPPEAEERAAFP